MSCHVMSYHAIHLVVREEARRVLVVLLHEPLEHDALRAKKPVAVSHIVVAQREERDPSLCATASLSLCYHTCAKSTASM